MENSHCKTVEEVLDEFNVDINKGLTNGQVLDQRKKYGLNQLPKESGTPLWKLILKQFDDILVRILVASAIISFVLALLEEEYALHSFVEPFVIVLILVINATVGVLQEGNAEKAIEALKEYEAPTATVIREGKVSSIPAVELVPGDIVELAVGDRIPADIRLLKLNSTALKSDQSALTGESVSVTKTPDVVPQEDIELQGKTNLLFSGSTITYGKCIGVVIATGLNTEIGKINEMIKSGKKLKKDDDQEKEVEDNKQTPLQRNLDKFGNTLSKIILGICILVWAVNITHFTDPVYGGWMKGAVHFFKIAVALGVAAIPEGLPTVITLTFAVGTQKMAKNNAIMRTLPAVETLGATSVICSDKTGTLTTNKMSVIKMVTVEDEEGTINEYEVKDTQYQPDGEIHLDGKLIEQPTDHICLTEMAQVCALCNDSNLVYDEKDNIKPVGEPTEAALRVMVEKIGVPTTQAQMELNEADAKTRLMFCNNYWMKKFKKIKTLEFTRARKSMSVYCEEGILFVKGAYEQILARCDKIRLNGSGRIVELSPKLRQHIISYIQQNLSIKEALRCLGLKNLKNMLIENRNGLLQ